MANRVDYEGQQLGNYRLLRLLGEGGFAEVYLAEHVHLKTQVAVKLLMARLAQDDIDKFRYEAQTIARLIHPNIVRVLDFGVERNAPYLAMDYAPNGTLRNRHPKGTRPPLEAIVSYVRQIAEALQYAHDQRLIHRDIKPENMLLGRNNEALLSDFGIALVTQSSRYPTSTQDVAGTISYMAPEQIQAHPRPASDQYSLGIVVYEWLSGNRPFQGSFTEIAVKHTLAPPPPLREQVPSLSPAIESVVMTALNKDPNQRFPTIRAFAQALQEAASQPGVSSFSTNIVAPPPPSPYGNAAPQLSSPYGSAAPPPSSPYGNAAPQSLSSYGSVVPPPPPVSMPVASAMAYPNMEPNPLALQYDPRAPSNSLPYAHGASAYPPYTASPYRLRRAIMGPGATTKAPWPPYISRRDGRPGCCH